jgi:hypothetical protein
MVGTSAGLLMDPIAFRVLPYYTDSEASRAQEHMEDRDQHREKVQKETKGARGVYRETSLGQSLIMLPWKVQKQRYPGPTRSLKSRRTWPTLKATRGCR